MPDFDSIISIAVTADLSAFREQMDRLRAEAEDDVQKLRAIFDNAGTLDSLKDTLAAQVTEIEASLAQLATDYESTAQRVEASAQAFQSAQAQFVQSGGSAEGLTGLRDQLAASLSEHRSVLERMGQTRDTASAAVPAPGSVPAVIPVPGSDRSYEGRYTVRELSEVQASHNSQSFLPNPGYPYRNDRDYANPLNAERVVRQAQAFDPSYLLTDNPDAVNGPPIVDPRGNVLGGNSRAMTLERVYAEHPEAAQAYREQLTAKAAGFGVDPNQIAAMQQPVLVRQLAESVNPQQAITDLNKVGTASLTSSERALSDSRRLSPETLSYLGQQVASEGDEGTLAKVLGGAKGPSVIQRLIDDGAITPQERPQYLDERGLVTPEGKQRVTRSVVGRHFDSPDEYENAPPSLRNNLERISGPLASVEDLPGWNIAPQTKGAVRILSEARQRGIGNLSDLEAQGNLFGGNQYHPDEMTLARVLQQGPRKAQDAFQQYAAEANSTRGGEALFAEAAPKPGESFDAAFRRPVGAPETGELLQPPPATTVSNETAPAAPIAEKAEPRPPAGTPPPAASNETAPPPVPAPARPEVTQPVVETPVVAKPAAPPAAPPPQPPAAPPSAPPPPEGDDEERKRAAREKANQEERADLDSLTAKQKESSTEQVSTVEQSLTKETADFQQAANQEKTSVTEVQATEAQKTSGSASEQQQVASVREASAQEVAAEQEADRQRQQASETLASRQKQLDEESAAAVRSATSEATSAVESALSEQSAASESGAAAQHAASEQAAESVEQSAATQASAAQQTSQAQQQSAQASQDASERSAAAEQQSSQARVQSSQNAVNASVNGAHTVRSAVEEAADGEVTANQKAAAQQAQSVASQRAQLAILQQTHRALAQEISQGISRIVSAETQATDAIAAGHQGLASKLQQMANEERAQLDQLIAKQDELAAAIARVKHELEETQTTVSFAKVTTEVGALTDSTGRLEFGLARVLATSKALGPILEAAFPLFAALGLIEILADMSGKVSDLYQNFVNLKNVQEEVEQVELRLAKSTESAFERTQENAVGHLRHLGQEVEAAQLKAQNLESKPIDLQQFLSDKDVEKKFKSLPEEIQKEFRSAFSDIIPSQLPAKIDELTRRFRDASDAAKSIRVEQRDLQTAPISPYGGGAGAEPLILEHKAKQQESAADVYGGLLQFLKQRQDEYKSEVVRGQDEIDDAQGRALIRSAEKQVSLLKQQGRDSAAAEKEIWQGVLAQLHEGTAAYTEVENKLGSLGKRGNKDVAQALRQADQEAFADLQADHQLTISEVIAFWQKRLQTESAYAERVREIKRTLGHSYQERDKEDERTRIQGEDQTAKGFVTTEGKPDTSKELDYWNGILAIARKGSQEYENALKHIETVAPEAIRATDEEVKKDVEQQFETWVASGHRTETEIQHFWESVASRYASDAPLVEEAHKKIEEAIRKHREELEKLKALEVEGAKQHIEAGYAQEQTAIQGSKELGTTLPGVQTPAAPSLAQGALSLGGAYSAAVKEDKELQALHEKEYQEALAANLREQAIYANDPVKLQELLNKEQQLTDRHNQQVLQDSIKLTKDLEQNWQNFFQTFNQGFTHAIDGAILHQKSFGQAMAQLYNQLLLQQINFVAQWLLKEAERWLLARLFGTQAQVVQTVQNAAKLTSAQTTNAAILTGTVATNAAITASNAAVNAAQIAGQTAAVTAVTAGQATLLGVILPVNVVLASSYAGLAASEEFAYAIGETMGNIPAATGMAAAALAIGEGYAGMAALSTGGYVPKDGVAMLHQGEVVVNHPITQLLGEMAQQGNSYRDTPRAVMANPAALQLPSAANAAAPAMSRTLQQSIATRGGDSHVHHNHYSPTFHQSTSPDMKKMTEEAAPHFYRQMVKQSKSFNRRG